MRINIVTIICIVAISCYTEKEHTIPISMLDWHKDELNGKVRLLKHIEYDSVGSIFLLRKSLYNLSGLKTKETIKMPNIDSFISCKYSYDKGGFVCVKNVYNAEGKLLNELFVF